MVCLDQSKRLLFFDQQFAIEAVPSREIRVSDPAIIISAHLRVRSDY